MRFVKRWTTRLRRRYLGDMTMRDEHLKMEQAFRECPGQWVAVDRLTGDVIAARETPYELSAYIKGSRIKNVDIVRSPSESEPEMVGFG